MRLLRVRGHSGSPRPRALCREMHNGIDIGLFLNKVSSSRKGVLNPKETLKGVLNPKPEILQKTSLLVAYYTGGSSVKRLYSVVDCYRDLY